MSNTIDYAKIFETVLDQQIVQESTTAKMELNERLVKYTGGNEMKIPKMSVSGLSDYSRATGFPTDGAISLVWETHVFDKDRGQTFSLDSQDVDESNFVATAGEALATFQREQVIPEIDAYRFSKIFTVLNPVLRTGAYVPAISTAYSQLKSDLKGIQSVIGEMEPLTIYASYDASDVLDRSNEVTKFLSMMDFKVGNLTTKVKSIDGIPIIKVPTARFKSAYTFGTGGFMVATLAMGINWIITANRATIAITKAEKLRVRTPEQNDLADAFKVQYRRYHTLIIPDNKTDAMFLSYTAIAAPELDAEVAAGAAAGTKFTVAASDGTTLGYILGTVSPAVKFNDIYSGAVYTSGADIDDAVSTNILTMLEVDSTGHVTKVKEETLETSDIAS